MELKGIPIAVDFDGTCVTHEYPKIGREIGAPKVLRRIVAEGGKIILWTMRSGEQLAEAVEWFAKHDIALYGIQRNPTQDNWTQSPKAYAKIYIDDAALGCPLHQGLRGERPFVNWDEVNLVLFGRTFTIAQSRSARKILAELDADLKVYTGESITPSVKESIAARLKVTVKLALEQAILDEPYDHSRIGVVERLYSTQNIEANEYTRNIFRVIRDAADANTDS